LCPAQVYFSGNTEPVSSVNKLTQTQCHDFQSNGFLHLEGLLGPQEVNHYVEQLSRIRSLPGFEPDRDPQFPIGHYSTLDHARDLNPEGFMDRRELLQYGPSFINLVDRQPGFDYLVDLMGPNIMLSMTQAIVRPSTDTFPGYIHTDGGESLRLTRVAADAQPIAVKIMYILTDSLTDQSGSLTVFPGSHVSQIPFEGKQVITPVSEGAVALKLKAGDAVLFTHSLWHGPSQNLSGTSRKIILYNYCQLWVRSYDSPVSAAILEQCTPRQRRLCGDLGYEFRPGSYFYVPKDQAQVILNQST